MYLSEIGSTFTCTGASQVGEGSREMLDQNADKPLNGTEYHPVNHDGTVLLAVGSVVFQFKPLRQLEVQLNGSALPGTANSVYQMEVDLGAVEGAVSFVDHIVQTQVFQRGAQASA